MIRKFLLLVALASCLHACGPAAAVEPTLDVNAIHTFAAETVIVEFTQTARAIPATSASTATEAVTTTQEATAPPTAAGPTTGAPAPSPTGVICDNANFDPATVDVTVPDGTQMSPGQDFVKTWKIQNTGSCTWGTGYTPIFAYGEKMGGIPEPLTGTVAPGEEVEISVRFKAPSSTGEFTSTWRMANASNIPFGEEFFVLIVVR